MRIFINNSYLFCLCEGIVRMPGCERTNSAEKGFLLSICMSAQAHSVCLKKIVSALPNIEEKPFIFFIIL